MSGQADDQCGREPADCAALPRVGQGSRVTLHFSLTLPDGAVIDSNFDTRPAVFTVGDGNLLPGFEAVLLGLAAGARQCFEIPPEQAFGLVNAGNRHVLSRSQFPPDLELEEGLVVSFSMAGNGETPGVVTSVEGDRVRVDFNHPLAGKTIIFEVYVQEVQAISHTGAEQA